MDTFSQSEDPPGHSPAWTNVLAATIALITLVVPLYITVEFSSQVSSQSFASEALQKH